MTHSAFGVLGGIILAILLENCIFPGVGLAFLLGYLLHIAADLVTVEGVVLLWPIERRRVRIWPAVRTGGGAEGVVLGIVLLCAGCIGYAYHPAVRAVLGEQTPLWTVP